MGSMTGVDHTVGGSEPGAGCGVATDPITEPTAGSITEPITELAAELAAEPAADQEALHRVADIADRARERNLDRAEELAGWVSAAEQGELTPDGAMVAAEVAHQLAGSAGTFGYQRATERARELEAIFNDCANTDAWQRASDCIADVIGELNLAHPDPQL